MAVPEFVVAPDPTLGWRVTLESALEKHSFVDKRLAIRYARQWADANRPSRVVVRTADGRTEKHWDYPPRHLVRRR
jgi:hypothetical protein